MVIDLFYQLSYFQYYCYVLLMFSNQILYHPFIILNAFLTSEIVELLPPLIKMSLKLVKISNFIILYVCALCFIGYSLFTCRFFDQHNVLQVCLRGAWNMQYVLYFAT